jgi:hypothetical protein
MTNNPRILAAAQAAKISIEQASAMFDRIRPIESDKRTAQWKHAELASEFKAEKVKGWALAYAEFADESERTCYEWASTYDRFCGTKFWEFRYAHRFSAWVVFNRYYDCEGAVETWYQWLREAKENHKTPKVDTLRAMMSERFGNEPTPSAARAKVGRLYRSLEGLQVDVYNTVPEAAKQELGVAFAAVGRAKKIMEAENGR